MKALILLNLIFATIINYSSSLIEPNDNEVVIYSNIYISNEGNDNNDGSLEYPIASINRLNELTLNNGADIYFAANDTFAGEIRLNATGLISNHINITSYGSGSNPVITGLTTLDSTFTEVAENLWKCNINYPIAANDTMLSTITGSPTYAVRPNHIQYVQKNDTFCELSLSPVLGAINTKNGNIWLRNDGVTESVIGGTYVSNKHLFIWDQMLIEGQEGDTMYFKEPENYTWESYSYLDNYIINHRAFTNSQNQFTHVIDSNYLYIYSIDNPNNSDIKYSLYDTLINLNQNDYVDISNIEFKGGQNLAVYNKYSDYITFTNCNFNNVYEGVMGDSSNYVSFTNCNFENILSLGIGLYVDCNVVDIEYCNFHNIGSEIGRGGSSELHYEGLIVYGDSGLNIKYCDFYRIGYMGAHYQTDYVNIYKNRFDSIMYYLRDGGVIYTYNANQADRRYNDVNITKNIVKNTKGTLTNYYREMTAGIYMDAYANGTTIDSNIIYNTEVGLLFNNGNSMNVHDNILHNTYTRGIWVNSLTGAVSDSLGYKIYNNDFVSYNSEILQYQDTDSIEYYALFDSNNYEWINNENIYYLEQVPGYYTLPEIQSTYSVELNADTVPLNMHTIHGSDYVNNPETYINLLVNDTYEDSTFSLGAYTWIDFDSVYYDTEITIGAFEGKILFRSE